MDEFPDSSDLAASRIRGEPCWGLEITSRIPYCAHCRSRSRGLLRAFRIQVVERLTVGTLGNMVGRCRISAPGSRSTLANGEFRPVAKPAPVWTRCSISSPAKSSGRRILTTVQHGRLFPQLEGPMRVLGLTPYPFWSIPRTRARNLPGKTLPAMNTEDRQQRWV